MRKEKSVGEQGYFTVTFMCWEKYPPAFSSFFSVLPLPIISMWAFHFSVLFLKLLWFNVTHVPIFITANAVPFGMSILGI